MSAVNRFRSETTLVASAAMAFGFIADIPDAMPLLLRSGLVDALVGLLRSSEGDATVVTMACLPLFKPALEGAPISRDAALAIISAVTRHQRDAFTAQSPVRAIQNLACKNDANKLLFLKEVRRVAADVSAATPVSSLQHPLLALLPALPSCRALCGRS